MAVIIPENRNDEILSRIYQDRCDFYHCKKELVFKPGIEFIPVSSLENTITLAQVGAHFFLRYDPNLKVPFSELRKQDLSHIDNLLIFLSAHFAEQKYIWNEPYTYHYKLDSQLPERGSAGLEIRRMGEKDYPEMNGFISECSEEDIDEADIYLDEPDPVIFCGYINNQIVSSVSHRYFSYDIADIGILIHPVYRRRGYGLAMVQHDTKWCLDNDKIPLYTVRRDNIGSVSLIRKLGFTPLVEVYRFHLADS